MGVAMVRIFDRMDGRIARLLLPASMAWLGLLDPTARAATLVHSFTAPGDPGAYITDFDFDGARLLFGARPDTGADSRAHLYDVRSKSLIQTFSPSGAAVRHTGRVALDGNRALLSQRVRRADGNTVSNAQLYDIDTGSPLTTLSAPQGDFGSRYSLDLSNGRALIGLPYGTGPENNGNAYLFDSESGDLLHRFTDPTPHSGSDDIYYGASHQFGDTVLLRGDDVFVGAPWSPLDPDPDWSWERRLADTLKRPGRAHQFDARTGELVRTFDDPSPTTHQHYQRPTGERFGSAMASDGEDIVISSPGFSPWGGGDVNVFSLETGELEYALDGQDKDGRTTYFGSDLALTAEALLIADHGINEAYLVARDDGELLATLAFSGGSVAMAGHLAVLRSRDALHLYDLSEYGLTPVPLPPAALFLASGTLVLGLIRHRRGRRGDGGAAA